MPADADAAALEAAARADEKVAGYLDGATVRRVIAVPGRLVNFVLGLSEGPRPPHPSRARGEPLDGATQVAAREDGAERRPRPASMPRRP